MTVDQPLEAMAKETQWSKPDVLGKDKFLGYDGGPAYWDDIHEIFRYELGFFSFWVNCLPQYWKSCYTLLFKDDDSYFYVFMVRKNMHTHTHTHRVCMYLEYLSAVVVLFFS